MLNARYFIKYSGWRKYMEDAILFHRINKDIFLFAVFDGHGGV
jgi:serine/threonine protein phosphatase PrpC